MKNEKKKINSSLSAIIDYSTAAKISKLITKYTVRILYLGGNRNGSYFTKEVVDKMVQEINGIPVIGHYDEQKGDFLAHGDLRIYVNTDDKLVTETVGPTPYGFVPNNAKVWWEDHLDKDGITRNYLCTEAYLWTGRYNELDILNEGRSNQSMELDPQTMTGTFKTIEGQDWYVVDHADFIGLCILGQDVEPCFEGGGLEYNFSLSQNDKFVNTLTKMKEELSEALTNFALQSEESEQEEAIGEPDQAENAEPVIEEQSEENPGEDFGANPEKQPQEDDEEEEDFDNSIDNLEGPSDEELQRIENENLELDDNLEDLEQNLDTEIHEYTAEEKAQHEKQIRELTASLAELQEKFNKLNEQFTLVSNSLNEYKVAEEAARTHSEKVTLLESYKDKLNQNDYQHFMVEIDNLSVEDLSTQAKDKAYEYMVNIFTNIKKDSIEIPNTNFTLVEEEQSECHLNKIVEPWMRAVLERQNNN